VEIDPATYTPESKPKVEEAPVSEEVAPAVDEDRLYEAK
jgi:hypothetical protein